MGMKYTVTDIVVGVGTLNGVGWQWLWEVW